MQTILKRVLPIGEHQISRYECDNNQELTRAVNVEIGLSRKTTGPLQHITTTRASASTFRTRLDIRSNQATMSTTKQQIASQEQLQSSRVSTHDYGAGQALVDSDALKKGKGRGYGDRNGYGYFKKRSNVAKAKDLATATTTPSDKATPFWRRRTQQPAQQRIQQKENRSKANGTKAPLRTTNPAFFTARTELAPGLHHATVTGRWKYHQCHKQELVKSNHQYTSWQSSARGQ